jgi:hypothetical protein
VLGLDVDLAEPVCDNSASAGWGTALAGSETDFSTVSLTFFSAASSSSSSSWILRWRPSAVVRADSPSPEAFLSSEFLLSAFSRSASSTLSLWLSEVMSWSRSSMICSYFLFLASAASARSCAASASVRSDASF